MTDVTLKVEGMTCGHCVSSVEKAVSGLGAEASVSLAAGSVKVKYDEAKLSLEQIKEAIEDQGYDVR
ncbi:copper ion binding protein [Paenibacillus sp. GCM10023252]|uniref:copper ion binding protein n=1 Tax=Paenibacillus sp. GCM10023252 TaxID=3252649 RepID=UPI00361178CD